VHSDLKRITESNRAAWNEVMPLHQRAAGEKWDRLFAQPGYVRLDEIEIGLFHQLGLKGKSVVHLCCNNGVELLSLKNLGAGECVGFDICDAAIREASERASKCQIDCQFVRSDVYEIDAGYADRFDLAYISVGCLGWMPDLELFFEKSAALLRRGGQVFIREIHPFSEMLPLSQGDAAGGLRVVGPYFKPEPYVEQGGLDYVGNSDYPAGATQYWFVHTLSSIVMGLIHQGITIEHFSESEQAVSPHQRHIEAAQDGVPLSYVMIGRKS
jgi:ubiquinone/menaquinone biosynthesis C-methylase UbiE